MSTREQLRMQRTWETLTVRFQDNPGEWRNKRDVTKYLGAVRRSPARIHTCGLGQALAFLKSRSKRGDRIREAYDDISCLTLELLGLAGETDLLRNVREQDADFFYLATEEAMLVCDWLSRYLTGAGVKPNAGDVGDGDAGDDDVGNDPAGHENSGGEALS